MKTNKDIQNELEGISEDIASPLEQLKNDSPYELPFNYFNEMQDSIFQQISNSTPKKELTFWSNLKNNLGLLLRPRLAFGVLTAVLVAGFFFYNNDNTIDNSQDIFAELDESTLENLIELNIESFEDEELFDLVENDILEDLYEDNNQTNEYIDDLLESLNDEEIINLF